MACRSWASSGQSPADVAADRNLSLSESLDRAFPPFDMSEAESSFRADQACADRLCRELHSRLHPNPLRICFEPLFVSSTACDLVWGDAECCEIFLPISQPIGARGAASADLRFFIKDPGFVVVRILESQAPLITKRTRQNNKEAQKNSKAAPSKKEKKGKQTTKDGKRRKGAPEKNPIDQLSSSGGQFLTPGAALKATTRLVRQALQQVASDNADLLAVRSVRLDKEFGTVRATVEAWPEFYQQADEEQQLSDAESSAESADERPRLVSFAFPLKAEDVSSEDLQQQSPTAEEAAGPRAINLRFTPALRLQFDGCGPTRSERNFKDCDNYSDCAYAAPPGTSTGMPVSAGAAQDIDDALEGGVDCLWALRYPTQEAAVLASLARADRGLRMRVWRGVFELCRRELGFRRSVIEHCLLQLVEAEIDSRSANVRGAWQLADCADCTNKLLARLRDLLTEGRLSHFFNARINLLHGMTRRERLAAAARLDLFLRRPEALLRAAGAPESSGNAPA